LVASGDGLWAAAGRDVLVDGKGGFRHFAIEGNGWLDEVT